MTQFHCFNKLNSCLNKNSYSVSSSVSPSLDLSCSLWLLALTQSSEQRQAFVQSTPDFRQEQSWLQQSFLQLQQSWDAISLGQGSLYPWTGRYFSSTSLQLYSSGFILFPCHAWTCESIYVAISTRICNILNLCKFEGIYRVINKKYLQICSHQMCFSSFLSGRLRIWATVFPDNFLLYRLRSNLIDSFLEHRFNSKYMAFSIIYSVIQ